jgi:hypothetical protein
MPRATIVPLTIGVQGIQLHSPLGISHCVEHESAVIARITEREREQVVLSGDGKEIKVRPNPSTDRWTECEDDNHWLQMDVVRSRLWVLRRRRSPSPGGKRKITDVQNARVDAIRTSYQYSTAATAVEVRDSRISIECPVERRGRTRERR